MSAQKGFTPILILFGIFLLLIIGGGAYYLGTRKTSIQPQNQLVTPTPVASITSVASSDEIANWKTYSNTEYNFRYPSTWQIEENSAENLINLYPPNASQDISDNSYQGDIGVDIRAVSFGSFPQSDLTQDGVQFITGWKKVNVDGVQGIYLEYHQCAPECTNKTVVPIKKGQQVIEIFITSTAINKGYTSIYHQILSTLKFKDQNQDPQKVVQNFYNTYLSCIDNIIKNPSGTDPMKVCRTQSILLSNDLLDKLTKENVGGDPVLCAQNIPNSISVNGAEIENNNAKTVVHTSYQSGDNPITVSLTRQDNIWSITDIKCQTH